MKGPPVRFQVASSPRHRPRGQRPAPPAIFARALAEESGETKESENEPRFQTTVDHRIAESCRDHYERALRIAEEAVDFGQALRALDMAARLWGVHMAHLRRANPGDDDDAHGSYPGSGGRERESPQSRNKHAGPASSSSSGRKKEAPARRRRMEVDEDGGSAERNERVLARQQAVLELARHRRLGARIFEARAQMLMEVGRGHDFAAVQAAKRAVDLAPEWSEGFLTLSRAELNFGDVRSAVESGKRAFKCDRSNKDVKEHLCRAQFQLLQAEKSGVPSGRLHMRMERLSSDARRGKEQKKERKAVRKRLKARAQQERQDVGNLERKVQQLSFGAVMPASAAHTAAVADSRGSPVKRFGVLVDDT